MGLLVNVSEQSTLLPTSNVSYIFTESAPLGRFSHRVDMSMKEKKKLDLSKLNFFGAPPKKKFDRKKKQKQFDHTPQKNLWTSSKNNLTAKKTKKKNKK